MFIETTPLYAPIKYVQYVTTNPFHAFNFLVLAPFKAMPKPMSWMSAANGPLTSKKPSNIRTNNIENRPLTCEGGQLLGSSLTWKRNMERAQVQGSKSAPAASCKQQPVRSVHVKVCQIVQAGISMARLGTFAVLSTDSLSSTDQAPALPPGFKPCPLLWSLSKGTFCTAEQGRHDNAWHDWHQFKIMKCCWILKHWLKCFSRNLKMQNFRHVAEAKPKACLPKQQSGKFRLWTNLNSEVLTRGAS